MKKHSMKLLAALLALVMLTGSLSACRSGDSNDGGSEAKASSQVSAAEPGGQSASSDEGAAGETVTLTALFNVNNTMTRDPNTFQVIQEISKATGVEIDWEIVRSGWDERKTLMLASGDLPDLFFGNRTIQMSDIMANPELFQPLGPYLDDCDHILTMFEEEPSMKKLVEFEDGSVYTLPSRMPLRPGTMTTALINQKWLDALGLSMPETTGEFTDVLRAFKTQDPNGNGTADEIPFTTFGTYQGMNAVWGISSVFGVMDEEINGTFLQVEDGQLVFTPATDGYKNAIKFWQDLYAEGLLDPECFTHDTSQFNAKMVSTDPQLVGVSGYWNISGGVGLENAEDYAVMPPLKDENGNRQWRSNPVALSMIPNSWCMSAGCENPEAAMRFMNELYKSENSVQLNLGSFGESTEMDSEGKIHILEHPDGVTDFNSWVWEVSFADMGPYYVSREYEENIIASAALSEKLDEDAVYRPYFRDEKDVYPPMLYTAEDSASMGIYTTDINNIVFEKMAFWISGEGDVEREWEAYLQSLDNVGLPALMEIYTKYWEENNA